MISKLLKHFFFIYLLNNVKYIDFREGTLCLVSINYWLCVYLQVYFLFC